MPSMKSSILGILEENRGKHISGQAIALRLGVTRSAVWKAVDGLRREGYDISSSTNAGYMLSHESDRLSAEGVRACLSDAHRDIEIVCLEEVDSTNAEAKRSASDGTLLVAANGQTSGRGRMGRSFFSPRDTGLYMTLAFKSGGSVEDAVSLTCAASVAVVRAIESLTDARPLIKWVNDVYLDGKKLCGILTEGIFDAETGSIARVIVGIGVNVNTVDFPAELDTAVSLCRPGLVRSRLAARIADELLDIAEGRKEWLHDYRSRSLVLGRRISYVKNAETFYGTAESIGFDGGLRVKREDGGEEILKSGEISLRLG